MKKKCFTVLSIVGHMLFWSQVPFMRIYSYTFPMLRFTLQLSKNDASHNRLMTHGSRFRAKAAGYGITRGSDIRFFLRVFDIETSPPQFKLSVVKLFSDVKDEHEL